MGTYATESSYQIFKSGLLFSDAKKSEKAQVYNALRLDTLESLEKKRDSKNYGAESRAELPAPKKTSDPDYLLIMAEAFSRSFDAMAHGVETETKDYLSLQKLDESGASAILESTTNLVTQQKNEYAIESKVGSYEKQVDKTSEISTIVLLCVGIAMAILTAGASMIADAVATSAVVAGDEIEMSTTTLPNAAESIQTVNNLADKADAASSSTTNVATEAQATDETSATSSSDSVENSVRAQNKAARDLNKSFRPENRAKYWTRLIGKGVFRASVGAAMGSPQLVTGLTDVNNIYPQLKQLADAQQTVGKAYAALSLNNTFFQFYQQLAQREGTVLQEQVSNISEVVQTFGDLTQAYRQISYGLADAV